MFSFTAGVILATLPGSIERSTAGFGDRDAFCLMLGLLAVITYLVSLQTENPRQRLFWTLMSGFIVFLGGISWEGFGVFLSVIMVVELWRFLTFKTETRLGLYTLWVCCFVPILYLTSPAYRDGYGFAEHLAAFVLMPPLVLLAMRAIRSLLISKVDHLRPHIRIVSFGLILVSATLGLGYILIQQNTFADTTVLISDNLVMQAMSELQSPHFKYWMARYGTIFIIGSLGFILMPLTFWKKRGILVSLPLTLFTITSFFSEPLDKFWGESLGNALFTIALVGCAIGLLLLAWHQKNEISTSELVFISFSLWFIAWVALARDAKRYDFFIGFAFAFGTTGLIQFISQIFSEKIQQKSITSLTEIVTAIALTTILMFLPLKHAHTYQSLFSANQMRKVTPKINVAAALLWIKARLPHTSIVAANWSYGSQLNVIGGVKTITDQDTYIQHWIDLYYKYVIYAKTEREALEYLKTHGATHLMLVGRKPAKHFLKGKLSDAFIPVYPEKNFVEASVNIWKIHYPAEIQIDDRYLKTGFPELDGELEIR